VAGGALVSSFANYGELHIALLRACRQAVDRIWFRAAQSLEGETGDAKPLR
jgi:hypothetical protein